MKTLRILIADDHDLMRRGLKDLLQSRPGWTVCAEAHTGREAVVKAEEMKPDIVTSLSATYWTRECAVMS
jgi:DNA-binding NarL/FixJ family response regulator